ncbi:hypothetical protein PV10_04558 [Exophiala mesophila]|uniref:Uncharacterized protein n=1 Tax=Exophiala mesophila TaxID=212818 RepID=A0A0D1WVG0_EXOME|nr:uncharacterized protein PV10_04558 [Exophiala mesophila]KIV93340.1 hypothetical protein PV10_04558 [Exophiala mesophila]
MDYQNLRGLRGRVTQWTGKIVDQLLDSKDSPGPGPTPPPPPNPPYNTHPQYGVNQQHQHQQPYQYHPNPQYSPNPQFGWSPPQYGSNYHQFPQPPINGNGQNYSLGGPPSPNPPPEDALGLRFNMFNAAPTETGTEVNGTWENQPPSRRSPGPAKFPPKVNISKVDFLGDVHSSTTYVIRDLGFQGRIGKHVLLSYGDTLWSDANYSDKWRGMVSDSVALATHDPLVVIDPILNANGYPPQFCPVMSEYNETNSDYALGITNIVETGRNQGMLFFLLNHRPGGKSRIVGAGVATIQLDTTVYPPRPHLRRLPPQTWWDAAVEPWWGDVCALRYGKYIYAYGHGADKDVNPWVYVARVRYWEALDINRYEYWNGQYWQRERLQTKDIGKKESVFWQINQGTVVWSNYFQCLIFVYSDNWWNSRVLMKMSKYPEGPWSEPITLYQATPAQKGGSTYAASPHPYFDESGRTLVCTFTNYPNIVQAIRVHFE